MTNAAGESQVSSHKSGRAGRIILRILIGIVAVFVLLVLLLNIFVRVYFAPFYAEAQQEFPIPGNNTGFVVQDQDYVESEDLWIFSGYMADGSASPLYKYAVDGSTTKIFVDLPDGSTYAGHGGGFSSSDDYAFLTIEQGYIVMPLDDVLAAQEGDHVQALERIGLDFSPAFLNIQDGKLMTGNYYYPGSYETPEEDHIKTPDGTQNYAVVYVYPADEQGKYGFAEDASEVYSITERCQGVCLSPDGEVVLSTSAGVFPSHFFFYDLSLTRQDGTFKADGNEVPLYCLDGRNLTRDVTAPPMSEGIVLRDGRIWFAEESASNKYIFGKFYFGGNVMSFPA